MATNEMTSTAAYDRAALMGFRARLHGELIEPTDEAYATARRIWNRTANRFPALIVKAQDAADVARSVHFAREHGLPLAVRSGGHSLAGYSTVDDGLILDLSGLKRISIDPESRTAWAQGGVLAGEYANAAQQYGLATSMGDSGTVGISGLTTGGGIGWHVRKQGLTIDNLLAAEIVTADGRIVNASATENPDLFWALRGGGGNFGIVTGFQYRLHPVGTILGGAIALPPTKDVIRNFFEFASQAPDELTMIAHLMKAPPAPFIPEEAVGQLMFVVMVSYSGDLDEGERVIAPLRALAEPIVDIISPMPYTAMFQLTAEGTLPARATIRSGFFPSLEDSMIDTLLEYGAQEFPSMGFAQIRVLGGQMARVGIYETAFVHRDAAMMLSVIDHWEDPEEDAAHHAWVNAQWKALEGYRSGVYVNFLEDEGPQRTREAYSAETYARLGKIKRYYDPTNLFRLNQNIQPVRLEAAA